MEEKNSSQTNKEPLCMQKIHRKVLDKGIPPDVMPGIKGVKVCFLYTLYPVLAYNKVVCKIGKI